MLPKDMENYFNEIARVLKSNGKCNITFYLSDKKPGDPYYNYSDVCHIYRKDYPEHGVFYNEDYIKNLFTKYGLNIEMIKYGTWSKKEKSTSESYQDVIVANKTSLK